jgi:hypothetical protein
MLTCLWAQKRIAFLRVLRQNHWHRLPDADAATKIVGNEIGIIDVGRQMYPILAGIYGNEFDPVDHKTLVSVRLMLSETCTYWMHRERD